MNHFPLTNSRKKLEKKKSKFTGIFKNFQEIVNQHTKINFLEHWDGGKHLKKGAPPFLIELGFWERDFKKPFPQKIKPLKNGNQVKK